MIAAPASPQIYRQFFTRAECRLLDSSPLETGLSEISLVRILLMRLLAIARRRRPLSLKRHASMLAAFSEAGIIVASLVRFNVRHGVLDDPDGALLQMFADMDPYDL